MKLSSEVHRLGVGWAMTVPTEASVDEWAISLRGLPGQPKVVDVVSESLDGALDLAVEVLDGVFSASEIAEVKEWINGAAS